MASGRVCLVVRLRSIVLPQSQSLRGNDDTLNAETGGLLPPLTPHSVDDVVAGVRGEMQYHCPQNFILSENFILLKNFFLN